jgi:hypothetical protein
LGEVEGLNPLSIASFFPLQSREADGVSDPSEPSLATFPPRDLTYGRPAVKSRSNFLNGSLECSTIPIQLIDEDNSWDIIVVRLTPNLFGLCFNTSNTIKNADCSIENSQRPENFECEVCVPGRVDKIDGMRGMRPRITIFRCRPFMERWPMESDSCRLNCNTSSSFSW